MKGQFRYVFIAIALLCVMFSTVMAAPVTQNITYQGMLTNAAGTPLTGTYTVTFKLYEISSGGSALATDTHAVQASKGVFTTQITTASSFFDGRALWLGITVGTDAEMTPRQELRPVPYALSLRPGSKVMGDISGYVLNITNNGLGFNKNGLDVETIGQNSAAIYAHTSGPGSNAVVGVTEADGPAAIAGLTTGIGSPGLYAYTTNASAQGVYAITAGSHSSGIRSITKGDSSPGIDTETTRDFSPGMYVNTNGISSNGLEIYAHNTSSDGVHAHAFGLNAKGVYGDSSQDAGVYGKGKEGGYFTTNQAGSQPNPLAGLNSSTSYDHNPGVIIQTKGFSSYGVLANTYGEWSDSVIAWTSGPNSNGVYATTWNATSDGVSVHTHGLGSRGIYARSGQSVAIWAQTDRSDNKYGLQTPNYIRALGYETGSSDIAEYMPIKGNISPGTVVVIGSDGMLQPSGTSYDTKVAGIVSTQPGISLGAKERGNPGEEIIAVAGRVPCKVDATHTPIHAGDLLTTSDNPGYAMKAVPDVINGHKYYPDGTILGKAMGSLDSGTGTIEVLVTLQ